MLQNQNIKIRQIFGLINLEQGSVAMMQSRTIIIEIYQMPEAVLAEISIRKNGHTDHVAFDVADIDATFDALQKVNFNIVEPGPVFPR